MAEAGTAFVSIIPTMRGFGPALSGQVGAPAAQAGKKAGGLFSSSFKGALGGIGAAFAGIKIAQFFGDSVKEASDLNESINAVRVSYGKAGKDILKLSKNSAKGFGLSRSEFNGFAVQFQSFSKTVAGADGNVTKTFDSIIGRARDFASVMNLEVSQAAELFQSGLAGETEPLRRYGIDLSAAAVQTFALAKGITKSGQTMTEAQKVQARYGLLMQKTSKFAGDFANTSDGLANAQRILSSEWKNAKATVGAVFLPALASIVTKVNDNVVPALSTAKDKIKDFLGGIDLSKLDDLDGKQLADALVSGVGTALDSLGTLSGKLFDKIGEVLGDVDWVGLGIDVGTQALPFLVGLATGLVNGITEPGLWKGIWDHLPAILLAALAIAFAPAKILGPIARIFGKIPIVGALIEKLILGLNTQGGKLLGAIGGFLGRIAKAFFTGFGRISFPSLLPKFLLSIRLIPTRVGVFLIDLAARFVKGAESIAAKFGAKMRSGMGAVGTFLAGLPAKFIAFFKSLPSRFEGVGSAIVTGLLTGLRSAWTRITTWLAEKIAGLSDAAKKLLGISSPSKVFMEIGEFVGLGMAAGLDASTLRVQTSMTRMVSPRLNVDTGAATADRPSSFLLKSGALRIVDGKAYVEGIISEQAFAAGVA